MAGKKSGVPARLSSFVGRMRELAELRRLLAHTRLLTLIGPGGPGKTRLATQFAQQHASRFLDGAVFAELGGGREESLVVDVVARAADINLESEDPTRANSAGTSGMAAFCWWSTTASTWSRR